MRKLRNTDSLIACLAGVILWETAVRIFHVSAWILPGPISIARALWEGRALILYHSLPTLVESVVGLACAAAAGVGAGILMFWSKRLERILYPVLILSQTIPFIALAPLLTVWLGFGILPKIIVVSLVCFFPIAIGFFDGLRSVDPGTERFMISLGATKWQRFRFVTFPGSLPSLFSGLKISAAYCVLGAVVSEWIGTDRGLGILLTRSAKSYLTDRVFAVIVTITLFSILAVTLVRRMSGIVMPWHYYKNNKR